MIDILFCGLCAIAMIVYCNRQWREKLEANREFEKVKREYNRLLDTHKFSLQRIEELNQKLSAEVEKNRTICATISTQHGIIHGQQVSINSAMRILGQHQVEFSPVKEGE
jgi:ribosomal protein L9